MRSQRLESAELVGRIVTSNPIAGGGVLMVYAAYASHGYRSNYERVPTYWWEVYRDGRLLAAKQYSGRRVATLAADFAEVAADPALYVDRPLRLLGGASS